MTSAPPTPPAQVAQLHAQPVSIITADGYRLSGELSLPKTAKAGQKFATVILLHGSGANDLNETLAPNMAGTPEGSAVFFQIAQKLNAESFAVLRFNKRGVTGVGPVTLPKEQRTDAAYTVSGYTKDALDVLNFARKLPAVDVQKVFLLGHSEGTMLAAKIAGEQPHLLRGIILMGTVGDSFRETLHWQNVDGPMAQLGELFDLNGDGLLSIPELTEAAKKYGVDLAEQAEALGLERKGDKWIFAASMNPNAAGEISIDRDLRSRLEGQFSSYPNLPGLPEQIVAYFRDGDAFGSVTQILPGYAGPVLMLQGEADPQTTLAAARKTFDAMQKAGAQNVTFKTYAGLGHTLSPLRNGLPTLGPMAETPLNDLAEWLKLHSR